MQAKFYTIDNSHQVTPLNEMSKLTIIEKKCTMELVSIVKNSYLPLIYLRTKNLRKIIRNVNVKVYIAIVTILVFN
jgi:hypothetical protein